MQARAAFAEQHIDADGLREVGYDGYVSVEMRNGWTTPDAKAVRQALEFAVKVYG